jgi:hypothetical protein
MLAGWSSCSNLCQIFPAAVLSDAAQRGHACMCVLTNVTPCLQVIAHVRDCYPSSTLFAAGWSLGANILVNYLGEQGADTPLEAAVSMCNPFDLTISNRHINEVSIRQAGNPFDGGAEEF